MQFANCAARTAIFANCAALATKGATRPLLPSQVKVKKKDKQF